MAVTLVELLDGATETSGLSPIKISGVQADSRNVAAGDAFFALPGANTHGDAFSREAVEQGAVVIISDRQVIPDPGVDVVIVPDPRTAFARAAAHMMAPAPHTIVGITGTSGKTSVASFLRQIWKANGLPAASIGTLGIDTGSTINAGMLTTPDPLTLHKSLAVLKAEDIDHVALEASSHGLDQRRLDGVDFAAAAFTNLSRDHLDYHSDMDDYREAKLRLFRELLNVSGKAVVNTDDPEHMPFMFAALDRGVTLLTVGAEGAFIEIISVEKDGFGQKITGRLVGEPLNVRIPLVGRFQASNAMIALALAMATGAEREPSILGLTRLKGARGRMEQVGGHKGGAIFVDYAHKPAALEAALSTLRPYATGKITVVFGCGGDRDKGKRPIMGEIAARLADKVIITDDNPRTEEPAVIRQEILIGAPDAIQIGDRAGAIEAGMQYMQQGDILLIAGKGHEDYQIIGTRRQPFSDQQTVKSLLPK